MKAADCSIPNSEVLSSPARVLVVGKNSSIVRKIMCNLDSFEFVSHKELDEIEIKAYDKVFIFSWSHNSLKENIDLLSKFLLDRVVFISTVAVLACARRTQWSAYPNWKLECENRVLKGGGQVIRIGIWDETLVKKLPGILPVSTPKALVDTLHECISSANRVFWPITMQTGELSGIKLKFSRLLNNISDTLPSEKFFQAPLAVISKILGFKDYNYTHDCLQFFSQRVLVGFGAVGSAISQELDLRGISHNIVVSREKNLFLNNAGFRGLRIGQYKEGLSRLWHGVWITELDNNILQKNVPLLVSRPHVPRKALYGRVTRIDVNSPPLPNVLIAHPNVAEVRLFAGVVHLAAGVINNVKILQATYPINATFSDHEICEIGCVATEELLEKGLITRRFGIVFGRKVLQGRYAAHEYLLDFRPKAPSTIEFDADNIYNNRIEQILFKLVKGMSLRLINQALFNKFGICFDVGSFSAVVQIEAPYCIELSKDGKLTRTRLDVSVLEKTTDHIASEFKSFSKIIAPRSFDAIHLHGGFDLSEFPDIEKHINNKRLFLHGNVFDGSLLGPFHNTIPMIRRELEVIE